MQIIDWLFLDVRYIVITLSVFSTLAIVRSAPVADDEAEAVEPEPIGPTPIEESPEPEAPAPTDTETEPETQPDLTPEQQGRLARFNGNFFQLYGFTNQLDGNLEAIAGNQLNFRGNLIEFLGNEESLKSLGNYLGKIQEYH